MRLLKSVILLVCLSSSMYSCHWVTSDGSLFTLTPGEKSMLIEMFPEDAETIEDGKLTTEQHQAWSAHRKGSDVTHRKYSRLNPEFTGFSKVSDDSYVGTFVIGGITYEYTVVVTKDDMIIEDNYIMQDN